jgi:hypothetical protein
MHLVDERLLQILPDGCAAAEADVPTVGGLASAIQRGAERIFEVLTRSCAIAVRRPKGRSFGRATWS